jgi:hypothetical protein
MTDKWQTRPLVREGAPYGQDCNFQWKINIWSWAPDGAWHQDRQTDWLSVEMWLWLWMSSYASKDQQSTYGRVRMFLASQCLSVCNNLRIAKWIFMKFGTEESSLHGYPSPDFLIVHLWGPITVAARSKAWTVFTRLNAGIVGSNPTQDLDFCVRVYYVFVLCL